MLAPVRAAGGLMCPHAGHFYLRTRIGRVHGEAFLGAFQEDLHLLRMLLPPPARSVAMMVP